VNKIKAVKNGKPTKGDWSSAFLATSSDQLSPFFLKNESTS
jgi:hypothetical protein